MNHVWFIDNGVAVLRMEQVWVIKNLEKGPLYGLLNAYGLLFYALEDLGMVYWIGMYNSIVKSRYIEFKVTFYT